MAAQSQADTANNDRVMRHALLAIAILLILLTALRTRSFFMDDAWTGFRYVENLRSGEGFVFQAGERVEGVTNTGWLLLLSLPSMVFEIPAAAKVLGLLLCVTAIVLCYALARDIIGGPKAAVLASPAILIAATHFDFVYYSLTGMETGLIAALLCAMALTANDARRTWLLPVLGAAAFLVRPEALLVYPLYLVVAAIGRLDPPKRLLSGAAIFVALIATITAARYAYFGALLPNTAGSKSATLTEALLAVYTSLAGLNPNVSVLFRGFAPLLLLALGAAVAAKRASGHRVAMSAAAVATGWAFATYAPVDWTLTGRYFGPYVPLAAALLWAGTLFMGARIFEMAPRITDGRQYAVLFAIPLLAVSTLDMRAKTSPASVNSYPGYVITSENLIEPCRWMDEHLPDDATIATRRIGAVGYITDRYIFDYSWGLVTPEVTPLVRAHGEPFEEASNPALAEVWREQRPDFLLEDRGKVEPVIEASGGTPERFEIHGIPYHVARTFDIGDNAEWILCARTDLALPWTDEQS